MLLQLMKFNFSYKLAIGKLLNHGLLKTLRMQLIIHSSGFENAFCLIKKMMSGQAFYFLANVLKLYKANNN
jgi:hypothetical protein